jgi:hypothetical protein
MDNKILNEITSIKKMMGILNESVYKDFDKNNIPETCIEGKECFFYYDGKIYKKNRNDIVMDTNPTELLTHLKNSGALGIYKTSYFGPNTKTGTDSAKNLVPALIRYGLTGQKGSSFDKYFPNYTQEDALSSLIIPWLPNADKVIHGLPLYSYNNDTVYLDYRDNLITPSKTTQVTDPSVSGDN